MAQVRSELQVESNDTVPPVALISDYPLRVILKTGERLLKQKRYDVAERVFVEALRKRPWSIRGLTGLGIAYNATNRPDKALRCFARVMCYRPDSPKAMEGCGQAFSMLEDYSRSEYWFSRALAAAPALRSVSIALGVTKLRLGEWKTGFKLYDLREGALTLENSIGPEKVWDGHADLNGKTVLIIGEQGYGDHIQFLRYCALLKEKGARTLFFTREPLRRLCEWVPSIDQILVAGQKADFDYAVMAMSLPGLFETRPDKIPYKAAYIFPPQNQPLGSPLNREAQLRVAIAWKGNPENSRNTVRSCPSELFSKLVESTERVDFKVLPFDLLTEENPHLATLPSLCQPNATFADVAVGLHDIDLIISVDTSIAHLGGALGKPTWLLIGKQPDWRWLTTGENSLWYDSVRLFRMDDDWPQLLARVKNCLDQLLDGQSARRPH